MNALQDKVKEQDLKIQRLESEIQGVINECETYQGLLENYSMILEPKLEEAIKAQFEAIKLRLIRTQ